MTTTSKLIQLPQEIRITEDELIEKFIESMNDEYYHSPYKDTDIEILKSARLPAVESIYESIHPFNSQGECGDGFFLWKFVFQLMMEKIGGDIEYEECGYLYSYEPDDPLASMLNEAILIDASAETFAQMDGVLTGVSASKVRDFHTLQEFRSANTDECLYKEYIKGHFELFQHLNKLMKLTDEKALKRLEYERSSLIFHKGYSYSLVMDIWEELGIS